MTFLSILLFLTANCHPMLDDLIALFIQQTDSYTDKPYAVWVEHRGDSSNSNSLRFAALDSDVSSLLSMDGKQVAGHEVFLVGESRFYKRNLISEPLDFDDCYEWIIGFHKKKFNPNQTFKSYMMGDILPIWDIQKTINAHGIKTYDCFYHGGTSLPPSGIISESGISLCEGIIYYAPQNEAQEKVSYQFVLQSSVSETLLNAVLKEYPVEDYPSNYTGIPNLLAVEIDGCIHHNCGIVPPCYRNFNAGVPIRAWVRSTADSKTVQIINLKFLTMAERHGRFHDKITRCTIDDGFLAVPLDEERFILIENTRMYERYSERYAIYAPYNEFIEDILSHPGAIEGKVNIMEGEFQIYIHDQRLQRQADRNIEHFIHHYFIEDDGRWIVRRRYLKIEPQLIRTCFDNGLYIFPNKGAHDQLNRFAVSLSPLIISEAWKNEK